jgi:hypothetical protein
MPLTIADQFGVSASILDDAAGAADGLEIARPASFTMNTTNFAGSVALALADIL